jgi:N6-adenosine-specific RNA methylase IME4
MIHQDDRYKTMPTQELMQLPIQKIAKKNSILFLWGTTPLIRDALMVMDAWGYTYKTTHYWIKNKGNGFYFRGKVEPLLVGIKGKVKAFRLKENNVYESKVGVHSHKPDYYYDLINRIGEKLGVEDKIELFATKRVPGWDAIGLSIGSEIKETLERM